MSELKRVYTVNWGRLETWDVLQRTQKQLKLRRGENGDRDWTRTARDLEHYKTTASEAWAAEATRLAARIGVCKADLQRLRRALGQAQKKAAR